MTLLKYDVMTRVAFAIAPSVAPCIIIGCGSSLIDDALVAAYVVWGEVKPSNMVTRGAAAEGKNEGGTMDTAVDMEEGMSVRPDLI